MGQETRRSCGECTLCCFTHGVKSEGEILTRFYEWCRHCHIGAGCAIYADRPLACARWKCAWLEGEGAEDDRPDKTSIVLTWKYTRLKKTLSMAASTPEALNSEYGQRVAREYAKTGYPVLREDVAGRKELVVARGFPLTDADVEEAIEGGLTIVYVD